MSDLKPGEMLAGYRVVRELGEGGQGCVYEVIDAQGTRLALKLLLPSESATRIAKEAEALATIEDVNVVRFEKAGLHGDRAWLVTELVEGETLRAKMNRFGGFPPVVDLLRWVCQACDGVAAAHAHHIVHRDIKPENILITATDVVKVIDFGFAKFTTVGIKSTQNGTQGTALYFPPEKLHGAQPAPSWDVYSMGVMVYEALAGAHPLGAPSSNVFEVTMRHLSIQRKSLGEVCPELLPELAEAVDRAMHLDPGKRPTMQVFADELRAALKRLLAPRLREARNAVPSREVSLAPTIPLPVYPDPAPEPGNRFAQPPPEMSQAPFTTRSPSSGLAATVAFAASPETARAPGTLAGTWPMDESAVTGLGPQRRASNALAGTLPMDSPASASVGSNAGRPSSGSVHGVSTDPVELVRQPRQANRAVVVAFAAVVLVGTGLAGAWVGHVYLAAAISSSAAPAARSAPEPTPTASGSASSAPTTPAASGAAPPSRSPTAASVTGPRARPGLPSSGRPMPR